MMNPKKNTKTGPPSSDGAPTSLGRQGLDVLKDVLAKEMVKENHKLGIQNDELQPIGGTLNSKVHIIYLGDEFTVDLRDGKQLKDGFVVPIPDVAPIPFLDLAQNSMYRVAFSENSDREWKLNVKIGKLMIGNPRMSILTTGHVEARNMPSGRPLLTVSLSPFVSIRGNLSNVSSDDIADDFQDFNQKATTRLMIGLPTPVKNERDITFTLNSVHLTVELEIINIALLNYDATVNEMPETILRRQVSGTFDNDKMFSNLLDKNVTLKSANKKLLSTRKWLSNVDFQYHGGSLKLSIEDGLLVTRSGDCREDQRSVMLKLFGSDDDIDSYKSCPFNTLNEVRVSLGGIEISDSRSGPPRIQIDYNIGRIFILYGPVVLGGGLDFRGIDPENFQWPGNHMARALQDSLRGLLTLPDEVHFVFAGLILRCFDTNVAKVVEVLEMALSGGEINEKSTDDTTDETNE